MNTEEWALGYVMGMMDLWASAGNLTYKGKPTYGEIAKGIDGICRQPENAILQITQVADAFFNKFNGATDEQVAGLLAFMRKRVAAAK